MPKGPIIALILGIIAGYWIGYKDAYRGEKAIGSRIGIALGRMESVTPEGMAKERQRRAEMMRDSIRAKSGLAGIDSAVMGSKVP
jgi:hypothetical protein